VTIAILDTGFETENAAFVNTTLVAQRDFVFGDSIVRNQAADDPNASQHGTWVWSLLAAELPGQIVGIAADASYILAKTEDIRSETRVEEDHWVAAIEWAADLGADLVTSSLSYLDFEDGFAYSRDDLNGDVAVTTIAADSAAALGIIVVNAAGNSGPAFRSITTPGDGDSVITVGAEDSLGTLRDFSARGPTADGRLKPDLVAPGASVFVLGPSGFARVSGTSFSTPVVAGTAALYRQVHPLHPPDQVLAALRRSATHATEPDSLRGWGRPDGSAAVVFPRGILVAAPSDTLLESVTPQFSWDTPEVPGFVGATAHRLVVASDTALAQVVLDTVVAERSITLPFALPAETRLSAQITALALGDSARITSPRFGEFVVPAWAELLSLSDPEGLSVRELRPVFRWRSPTVASPPGPFTYDVHVIRADDGLVDLSATDLTTTEYTPTSDLERNTPYRWRVIARLGADSAVVDSEGTFLVIDDTAPSTTLLYQNFPNPFPNAGTATATTCIWFDLARAGQVRLDVLDIRGRLVRTLIPAPGFPSQLEPGRYGRPEAGRPGRCDPRLEWDGTATDGSQVPQGVYLIRLQTPAGTLFRRAVFLGPEA
ncbi:MAG: S8 family serine peptidase, partial [Gemmatimonadales bacterium]